MKKAGRIVDYILMGFLTICSVAWIYPIFMILINSVKAELEIKTDTIFQLPTAENFVGLEHYINALDAKGFFNSFIYSLFITVTAVSAI